MPAKDRTFTPQDIIRIIDNNLDFNERVGVLIAICSGVKIAVFDGIPLLVPKLPSEEALEEQDIAGFTTKAILKLLGL